MAGAMELWPWLAVAGTGALHGLNPCTGWGLAAAAVRGHRDVGVHVVHPNLRESGLVAWSEHSEPQQATAQDHRVLRALLPIALGHAASTAALAATVALGLSTSGLALQCAAGALLLALLARRWWQRDRSRRPGTALALTSFIAATGHGTGLMLVPALVPLCLSNSPARALTASGSITLALAAVAVHLAAMLGVTAALAMTSSRALAWCQSRLGWGQAAGIGPRAAPLCQAVSQSAGRCGEPSANPRTTQPAAAP